MIDEQEESDIEDEIDNVIDNDEAEIQGTEDAEIIDDIPVNLLFVLSSIILNLITIKFNYLNLFTITSFNNGSSLHCNKDLPRKLKPMKKYRK